MKNPTINIYGTGVQRAILPLRRFPVPSVSQKEIGMDSRGSARTARRPANTALVMSHSTQEKRDLWQPLSRDTDRGSHESRFCTPAA